MKNKEKRETGKYGWYINEKQQARRIGELFISNSPVITITIYKRFVREVMRTEKEAIRDM